MLESIAKSNPQIRAAFSQIQAAGGDGKTAFYNAARAMGMSENEIQNGLESLSSMLGS